MKTGSIRRTVLCVLTGSLILAGSVYAERWDQKVERRRAGQKYITLLIRQSLKYRRPYSNGQFVPLRPDAYWENLRRIEREKIDRCKGFIGKRGRNRP